MRWGVVPPEPARIHALDGLAPKFKAALLSVLADVPEAMVYESLRTDERQRWLYGFSRDYDDGDGWRTNADSALTSWHGYGVAADLVHRSTLWGAPDFWWKGLAEAAERHGLTAGYRWKRPDKPHIQLGGMKVSPSDRARALLASGGVEAVWKAVSAL